uniref:Bulb-type lectin domain-containing protein n=1 Tax=Physcomitrium patens TaxID=3218 RepID=A0A2K1JYQ0_PHYPA|nr:hypothetical protein PHYPA_013773 [Physcomitrium patens]
MINTTSTIVWSKPCPRVSPPVPIDYIWCRFGFYGGDLVQSSGNGTTTTTEMYPNPTTLWSSNTSALGAVAWELLDSNIEDLGNLVLYNANNEIVWRNIANNPELESYQCATIASAP